MAYKGNFNCLEDSCTKHNDAIYIYIYSALLADQYISKALCRMFVI